QVYLDLLHRPVDSAGLANWTNELNQGMSRPAVVQGIESSLEYRTDLVQSLYVKYLHRNADPAGLNGFVNFLCLGGSPEQVAAIMLSSPEYFQTRAGGSTSGFLDALYQDALNRAIDPSGQATYSQALARGVSRTEVAAAIVTSGEYCHLQVQGYYQTYLHRPADGGGLNVFAGLLLQGSRDQDVLAYIVGSPEDLAH